MGSETFWGSYHENGVVTLAGISDRVQSFLEGWPMVRENLDKLLSEEKNEDDTIRDDQGNGEGN